MIVAESLKKVLDCDQTSQPLKKKSLKNVNKYTKNQTSQDKTRTYAIEIPLSLYICHVLDK